MTSRAPPPAPGAVFAAGDVEQLPGRGESIRSGCGTFMVGGMSVYQRDGWLLDSLKGRPVKQLLNFHPIRDTYHGVLRSFADKRTAAIWADRMPKGFPSDLARAARRKLRMIAAATRLEDLRSPPGNHLEALARDRVGQHSIRINDQWRLCFVWRDGDAYDVEIVDYH